MKKTMLITTLSVVALWIAVGASTVYNPVDTSSFLTADTVGASVFNDTELSIVEDSTLSITGAGGFQGITNWQENISDSAYTSAGTTGITVNTTGRYLITMDTSFTTASASRLEAHCFTNGVIATDAVGDVLGWQRTIGGGTDEGSATGSGILTISAGTVVEWRLDADADEDITWFHGRFRIEKR